MTDRNSIEQGHCIPLEMPEDLFGIARAFEIRYPLVPLLPGILTRIAQ